MNKFVDEVGYVLHNRLEVMHTGHTRPCVVGDSRLALRLLERHVVQGVGASPCCRVSLCEEPKNFVWNSIMAASA